MRAAATVLSVLLAATAGLLLIGVMLDLPPPPVRLPVAVAQRLGESGVSHPVTAVLLNFRGYDTLLEVGVLLLALLGVLAAGGAGGDAAAPRPGPAILQALARTLTPVMVLAAGYLLWAGAHRPGGAFQAGAVLAAGAVLLHVAGLLPARVAPGPGQRWGLAAGLLVFAAVGAMVLTRGTLLQYPPHLAGALILLIEASLTVSLGLMLAGLFLFPAAAWEEDR